MASLMHDLFHGDIRTMQVSSKRHDLPFSQMHPHASTKSFDTISQNQIVYASRLCRIAKLVRHLILVQEILGSNPSPAASTNNRRPTRLFSLYMRPVHLVVRMQDSQSCHRGSTPLRATIFMSSEAKDL